MSSVFDERDAYLKNPFYKKEYGDFSPFYATVAVCTILAAFLFILNIVCCCCSKHHSYWQDRHTGNRWLVSIWSATPHKQPPLDYTELEAGYKAPVITNVHHHYPEHISTQYTELQKRESEI
ncbi:uncharacterized protein LOC113387011 [Ctenocephalides felis]|uniref:uncharacterized protein LOC113387010 n=1 Tax=Ctenocephalides felis TaxID=7515 RepID=UPI000E6E4C4C|nr:uncharacterized protein LOC113387010 [Ctenocephalides felis]XP_026480556.1 uncharacterized protein LOC113387011 [Ctenocephalides felis]